MLTYYDSPNSVLSSSTDRPELASFSCTVSGVGSGGTKGFSHISLAGSVTTPHGYSFHFTASAEL